LAYAVSVRGIRDEHTLTEVTTRSVPGMMAMNIVPSVRVQNLSLHSYNDETFPCIDNTRSGFRVLTTDVSHLEEMRCSGCVCASCNSTLATMYSYCMVFHAIFCMRFSCLVSRVLVVVAMRGSAYGTVVSGHNIALVPMKKLSPAPFQPPTAA
jgi:hypothetical protein